MSASFSAYHARETAIPIETAHQGIDTRQTTVPLPLGADEPLRLRRRQGSNSSDMTMVETAVFDFTPPQHAVTSLSDYSSDFDNEPPETMQPQIKGAHFGLPYAQRYKLPHAPLHAAPATIGYKAAATVAAQHSLTRRAGRIQLSLRQTPKLGRAAIKVVDFFQMGKGAGNRPSAEPLAAFGEDHVKRYSQQRSECHRAAVERKSALPYPATTLQNADENPGSFDDCTASGAERSTGVHAILRTVTLQQHRPRLVNIGRS
ncbi:hypothetical protein IWW38_003225, partial [Coemansia aciculifera]